MDDGFRRVDARFAQVDARFDALYREMNTRFDALQRLMVQFAGIMIAALVGLLATQVGIFIALA